MLKPVDDTRMFEKMGQSLADTGSYYVHIIGFPSSKAPAYPNMVFHPSGHFRRVSVERLFRPLAIFLTILSIRPAVLIITTHELLVPAIMAKLFTGLRIVYDIQENYYRNIRFLPSFPEFMRVPLALYVRLKEKLLYPFIHLYVLSDGGYKNELGFIRKKYIVVENKVSEKFSRDRKHRRESSYSELIFSGTLSESTGLFTAIELGSRLFQTDNRIRLTLIGYCPMKSVLEKLRNTIQDKPFIRLIGGDRLVPHDEVIAAIQEADFGIVAYPPNLSTMNTVPTKLYEYLAAELPILMVENSSWMNLCKPYPAAIVFHPEKPEATALIHEMRNRSFYTRRPGPEVFWETEATKLLSALAAS